MVIFGGSAHPNLTASIARELDVEPGRCSTERFPDGELTIRLLESVRNREVCVVQPTSPPVNDHLVELLAFADACRRAAAARIIAVIPYFGYARADKRVCRREPITAGMVATLLEAVGVAHVLTLDLHTPQIEGFFRIPVDTLTAVPVLSEALRDRVPEDAVVVSPDAGRVRLATEYTHRLGSPLVVLHKQRTGGATTRVTHIVGDVRGRRCIVVDDMISTGGTLVETLTALREAGAHPDFTVVATHGLLLNGATRRLAESGVRDLYVTDSVPIAERGEPLRVVSVAPLLARAVRQFAADGSLAALG
jgi:ribose-phosphate pyrophosphokinase